MKKVAEDILPKSSVPTTGQPKEYRKLPPAPPTLSTKSLKSISLTEVPEVEDYFRLPTYRDPTASEVKEWRNILTKLYLDWLRRESPMYRNLDTQ